MMILLALFLWLVGLASCLKVSLVLSLSWLGMLYFKARKTWMSTFADKTKFFSGILVLTCQFTHFILMMKTIYMELQYVISALLIYLLLGSAICLLEALRLRSYRLLQSTIMRRPHIYSQSGILTSPAGYRSWALEEIRLEHSTFYRRTRKLTVHLRHVLVALTIHADRLLLDHDFSHCHHSFFTLRQP